MTLVGLYDKILTKSIKIINLLYKNINIGGDELSKIEASVTRASMLITDNMTSFDQNSNLTKPRIATTYEAMMFTEDGGYYVVDNERFDITKGSVRFIKPGQEIYSKKYKDAYVIYFTVNECGFELIEEIPPHHFCNNYNENINLFQSIIKCFVNLDKEDLNNYLMYAFLLRLIHNFLYDSKKYNNKMGIGDTAVVSATNYIQYNYSKPITLFDIAKNVNLHPNYFHKLFKNKVGKTPLAFLPAYPVTFVMNGPFSVAIYPNRKKLTWV